MELILTSLAALVLVIIFTKWDAEILRLRLEIALAFIGVDYKPSRAVCFIIAALLMYFIFGVIIER